MKRTIIAAVFFSLVLVSSADAATCPTLKRGSTGASVTALQQFLRSQYADFPEPSAYFGPVTEAAVQRWQKEHGVVSSGSPATTGWGAVGPRTAAAMRLCGASASNLSTTPPPPPTSTTPQSGIGRGLPPPPPTEETSAASASSLNSAGSTTPASQKPNGAGVPPVIQTFFASPAAVYTAGDQSILSWSSSLSAECTLERGTSNIALVKDVGRNGSYAVRPDEDTQYSIKCIGQGDGSTSSPAYARKSLIVTIQNPKPTCSLKLDKNTYLFGDTIVLSWTTKDATSASWVQPQPGALIQLPYESQNIYGGKLFINANGAGKQTVTLSVRGIGGTNTCDTLIVIKSPTSSVNFSSQVAALMAPVGALLSGLLR